MKKKILLSLLVFISITLVSAGVVLLPYSTRVRYYAQNPDKGYHAGFYLYISPGARQIAASGGVITLLVQPNNTGRPSEDPAFHKRDAWWTAFERHGIANDLEVAVLVPAFIRPKPSNGLYIYSHALDRVSLTSKRKDVARIDLQLLAMIDDIRVRLAAEGMQTHQKFLLQGFSASGMFANRFSIMHPDRVMAVAVGSPGGWPVAPMPSHAGQSLRYPAGTADLEILTGKPFDEVAYAGIPQVFFMGTDDDNDAVGFPDGWDKETAAVVDGLFGTDPISRWPHAENLYKKIGANAQFILVDGVGHSRPKLQSHGIAFFADILERQRSTQ
jgi:hypothetical protein